MSTWELILLIVLVHGVFGRKCSRCRCNSLVTSDVDAFEARRINFVCGVWKN